MIELLLGLAKDGSTNYLVALCIIGILSAMFKIDNKKTRITTIVILSGLALSLKILDIIQSLI